MTSPMPDPAYPGAGRPGSSRDQPRLLHAWVERSARVQPSAVALHDGDTMLSYAELDRLATERASRLVGAGVAPGDVVAISLQRGFEAIVSILAALKAGAAYTAVDPDHPDEWVDFLLSDSRPKVLITASYLPYAKAGCPVFLIDDGIDFPLSEKLPKIIPSGDSYVIYTSGSTGRPKGSVVSHDGISGKISWLCSAYPLEPSDVVLQKTPFTFDVSVCEIFWPLACGARLVIAEPGGHRDSGYLADLVIRHDITVLHFVPSMLELFIREPLAARCSTLRLLMIGGEVLTPAAVAAARALTGATVVNLYAPSECAVYSLAWSSADAPDPSDVTLGRPLPDTAIHILDDDLRPVPAGEPGQIMIGGPGVGRGYLGRPALTAQRYLADPFGPPGSRMFASRDLGRRRPDGQVEFLGRQDTQVKVRGFRVEPGEIETALLTHPAVRQAVVIARPDHAGTQRLLAYVVPQPASGPEPVDLRAYLGARLPEYLVPSGIVVVEAFPLSPNGKLDPARLPDPPGAVAGVVPLQGDLARMHDIWVDVLGLGSVDVDTDLLDLGGHSLTVGRILARVRAEFGVEISFGDFFGASTIRSLADRVRLSPPARQASPIRPVPAGTPVRLAPPQERLWALDRMSTGDRAYRLPTFHRVRGELDVTALGAAVEGVVARHDALRMHAGRGDRDVLIAELDPDRLPRLDLSVPHRGGDRAEQLSAWLDDFAAQPFDLAAGPPVRFGLLRLAPDDHVLGILSHHLFGDGWSQEIILRDLGELYLAIRTGTETALPRPRTTYAGFAAWSRSALTAEVVDRELAYWRSELEGAPADLALPRRSARRADHPTAGQRVVAVLPAGSAAGVTALARDTRTTPFAVLLAAFSLVLSRWTGQARVPVGVPLAGRVHRDLDDVVGFFNNTVVLDARPGRCRGFRELIAATQLASVRAQQYQQVPFEQVVRHLRVSSGSHRRPFSVWFNMPNYPIHPLRLSGADVAPIAPPAPVPLFELCLYVVPEGAAYRLELLLDPDVYDPVVGDELLAQLTRVLDQVTGGVDPLAEIRLGDHEPATPPVPPGPSLPWWLADADPPAPDEIAVSDEAGGWTRAELLSRADAAATALRSAGVRPGQVVGLLGPRRKEIVPAILGALRAGTVFCVLDPAHPRGWLDRQLAVATARALLTWEGPVPEGITVVPLPGAVATGRFAAGPIDGPAYLAFTSGTTGSPAGVLGGIGPVLSYLDWAVAEFGVGAADRIAVLSGLGHDPLLRDVLLPLHTGARVCVPSDQVRRSPDALVRWLTANRVTLLHATPSLLRLLVRVGTPLPSVRLVVAAGEALLGPDTAALRPVLPGAVLVNGYGTTETPQLAACHVVTAADERPVLGTVPIGQGVNGASLLIMCGDTRATAPFELGELVVQSPQLALGYLDPDYRPDRFESGRYRTGDLARLLPDGSVALAGRADDQIKIHGNRVEPQQVEQLIRAVPGVADAAVVVTGHRLSALVMPAAEPATESDLRTALVAGLPAHLIPTHVEFTTGLPLTSNGKIDRSAVRRVLARLARPSRPSRASLLNEQLLSVWRQVLGTVEIDADISFFELGATSLHVVLACERLAELLGRDVSVLDFFRHSTVTSLAEFLARPDSVPQGNPISPPPAASLARSRGNRRLAARRDRPRR